METMKERLRDTKYGARDCNINMIREADKDNRDTGKRQSLRDN